MERYTLVKQSRMCLSDDIMVKDIELSRIFIMLFKNTDGIILNI